MLKRFEVKAYDGGRLIKNLVLDLTADKDKYDWNKNLVENGIVQKALLVFNCGYENMIWTENLVHKGLALIDFNKRPYPPIYVTTYYYKMTFDFKGKDETICLDVKDEEREITDKRRLFVESCPDIYYIGHLPYKKAVNIIKEATIKDKQKIFFTNQIALMDNKLTRPDCCFLVRENEIKALDKCTDKEIRFAHNLEAMYKNGAFD